MNVARRLWIAPLVLLATNVLAQQPALTTTPRKVTLHIEPQAVGDALSEFGRQTGLTVMIQSVVARGVTSPKLDGNFTLADALDKLLSHTGLHYEYLDAKTVAVLGPRTDAKITARKTRADEGELVRSSGPESDGPLSSASATNNDDSLNGGDQSSDSGTKTTNGTKLEQIVITGTHIRGESPVGSSVRVYSHDEIEQSGAATLDQFARQMVENFSGVDTISNSISNSTGSRFSSASANTYSGAAFDLHGIGPSATLTLLNGHRLAPAGGDGSLTDISQVPLGAIDHIEVLADGASAIYGADAVAGVVNIITRKDFDGAETGLHYGAATSGGGVQRTATQLLGHSWGTGNAILNYEFSDQGGLDASKRAYIGDQGGPYDLIPKNRRNSVFLSGSQNLGVNTTIFADAIYSDRRFSSENFATNSFYSLDNLNSGSAKQSGAAVTIERMLIADWRLNLGGNYSNVRQARTNSVDSPDSAFLATYPFNSSVGGGDLMASGPLFSVPAGTVKAAIGASFRVEKFDEGTPVESYNGTPIPVSAVSPGQRHVASEYAELFVPIVGRVNAISGAERVELSVAVRHDHYSDFGSSTNPKVGILWEPVRGFDIRGTYGTSFQAPLLAQIDSPITPSTAPLPDSTAPSGYTDTIYLSGGNPGLHPEKSKSFTSGFDFQPAVLPDLQFAATYFHITFNERIAVPPVVGSNYFDDPTLTPFITRSPSPTVVQAYFNNPYFMDGSGGLGPSAVQAIFDSRYANIASTRESGIDFTTTYGIETPFGRLTFAAAIDRLLQNSFQTLSGTLPYSLLNTFGEPTRWKGRGSIGWSQGGWTASLAFAYVESYQNTLVTPDQRINSWTTEDVFIGYKTSETSAFYALRNVTIGISINNLTNSKPPYAEVPSLPGQNPIPFDAANSSPLGRVLNIQLSKRW
jgi:iron complex outermembrane receptor protein